MPRLMRYIWTGLALVVLTLGAVIMLVPFLDMVLGALRTPQEQVAIPPVILPRTPRWGVFADVWNQLPMGRFYFNSIVIALAVTALVLFTSSLTGFLLAKYEFRGRDLLFRFILATQMFPQFIFLIPVYYLLKTTPLAGGNDILGAGGAGLLHSRLALILPFACSSFGIFLMRQFMVSVPNELLDAGRIDGASEWRIYWQLVLPNVRPALATLGIFTFMSSWNEFIWAMIITTSARELMTLPVGIQFLRNSLDTLNYEANMRAALTMAVGPILLLFLFLQRYYVRGFVSSGFKG